MADQLLPKRLLGSEPFHVNGVGLRFSVLDFWSWSCSSLVGNALRGVLAEYLVAQALGCCDGVRAEWDACDLRTASGVSIEVKASGYVQAWEQRVDSRPSFDIAPKRSWFAATNTFATEACRSSDVYVFALHAHRDRATIDPIDVSQWEFYVLSTPSLTASVATQKRINLSRLSQLGAVKASFADLAKAVEAAIAKSA